MPSTPRHGEWEMAAPRVAYQIGYEGFILASEVLYNLAPR